MRNSILISLVFFLLLPSASSGAKLPDVDTCTGKFTNNQDQVFPDDFRKGLFRMTMDVSKNHLSGYLLIKRTSDSSVSIFCSNEFGICFFNFEFVNGKFLIHTLFPSFNRKSLLSLLEKDFRLIIFSGGRDIKARTRKPPDDHSFSYKVSRQEGTYQYYISADTRKIQEIRTVGRIFSKTILHFSDYHNDLPGTITISHPMQNLRIKLLYLNP